MVAGLSLLLLVLVAYLARGRGLAGGCALALAGVLWLVADKPVEGPTILHVTADHGLTAGDLAGLAAVLFGVAQAWRARPAR